MNESNNIRRVYERKKGNMYQSDIKIIKSKPLRE
jgi:hypothetical protein